MACEIFFPPRGFLTGDVAMALFRLFFSQFVRILFATDWSRFS